jgi:hypothetical protein
MLLFYTRTGLNSACRLSGNADLPAYPGFIVINTANRSLTAMSDPMYVRMYAYLQIRIHLSMNIYIGLHIHIYKYLRL